MKVIKEHQFEGMKIEEREFEGMKVKEIEAFGVRITIFDNGDVTISTEGDIHIVKAKHIFK